jgi:hypothetical protein
MIAGVQDVPVHMSTMSPVCTASSVPPPAWSPQAAFPSLDTAEAAGHCGCGRGPALREPLYRGNVSLA